MTDREQGTTPVGPGPPTGGRAVSVLDAPDAALQTPKAVYSKDYTDIVLAQIQRRPTAMLALFVLVLLYAIAIYAPLIANDRPLYFEGVDLGAYRKAHRELSVIATSLGNHMRSGGADAGPGWLASERLALETRVEAMRKQLDSEAATTLDRFLTTLEHATSAYAKDPAAASEEAGALVDAAERVRTELRIAADGTGGVVLQRYRAFPALSNLGRGDVYFMVLWALVLLWPAWNPLVNRLLLGNDRARVRTARKPKMLVFILVPLAAAAVWSGETSAFYVSTFKDGLSSGDIVAERVVFAPAPYGIAETNSTEHFRPPTWHIESVINEQGYYEYGPRGGRFDEATGLPKPAKPVNVRFAEPDRNSNWRHPLGTDSLGRDILTRLVWGARVSLAVGIVSTVILAIIGTIVGSVAGYYGGWVDLVVSRVIEVVQTFPVFFLILIVVAFVGPSILNIMLALGLIRWTGVARLVRGEFIRLREQDFVVASRALGVRNVRTIFRHILPNAMGPVLVAATFSVATGILTESALSFLGFGVKLPIPSWGSLFIESRSPEHWWIQIYPGVLIFVTVMLYNLLGEGVRDALDPKLKVT